MQINKKLYIRLIIIFIITSSFSVYSQSSSDSVYNYILSIKDSFQRYNFLQKYLAENTQIENPEAVRTQIFFTALATGDSILSMNAAQELIKNAVDIATIYNRIAFNFAKHNIFLDSALEYATRANQEYERVQGRKRVPFMDTKAKVFYKLGDYQAAYQTQKEALALYPKEREWDPNFVEYYFNFALYMYEYLKSEEALILMARCSFFGHEEATQKLEEIFQKEQLPFNKSDIYKKSADEFFKNAEDINDARAIVALGLAKQNILLDEAYNYAQLSINSINENTSLDQLVSRYTTIGVISVIKGDYESGIEFLNKAVTYSVPYNTDLYLFLGKAYEAIGDIKKAYHAYLDGVLLNSPDAIMSRLQVLHSQIYSDGPELEDVIKDQIKKIESFEVLKYEKPEGYEKVVLAELFTGSECKPCLAADYAFDKLLERYDENTVAVLEYHLHIPAPDPMTNRDTEERAKFYNVNSTPTSIIEGKESISAGGPKVVAKSRFKVFSTTIEKYLKKNPDATINLISKKKKNKIAINCTASTKRDSIKDLRLFVVLAEERVHYQGYNTVSEHRFVVRKILPKSTGLSFGTQNKIEYNDTIDLTVLEDTLKNYLESFEKKANRKVFKEKKYKINENNLYLVAFIQDENSKEILQAKVVQVK